MGRATWVRFPRSPVHSSSLPSRASPVMRSWRPGMRPMLGLRIAAPLTSRIPDGILCMCRSSLWNAALIPTASFDRRTHFLALDSRQGPSVRRYAGSFLCYTAVGELHCLGWLVAAPFFLLLSRSQQKLQRLCLGRLPPCLI